VPQRVVPADQHQRQQPVHNLQATAMRGSGGRVIRGRLYCHHMLCPLLLKTRLLRCGVSTDASFQGHGNVHGSRTAQHSTAGEKVSCVWQAVPIVSKERDACYRRKHPCTWNIGAYTYNNVDGEPGDGDAQ
jgi:hypothetical protein